MKLPQTDMILLGVLVVYIAFFTNPPPNAVTQVLATSVGNVVVLAGILVLSMKVSLLVGMFAGIAYVLSSNMKIEFLDPKEQTPKDKKQPVSAGVSAAAASGILKELLGKAGKIPSVAGKSVTAPPVSTSIPKPAGLDKGTEHFSGV